MTSRSEIERVLDRYLADGAEQIPDRVMDAALDEIDQTPQRRALRAPWRLNPMSTFLKPVLAAAVVAAAVVVGGIYLTRDEVAIVGAPTAAASPLTAASAAPSAASTPYQYDLSTWVPFRSERYGYTMSHPARWEPTAALRDWSAESDPRAMPGDGTDMFLNETQRLGISVMAVDVPPDVSDEEWITDYYELLTSPDCDPIDDLQPITVGGRPGLIESGNCFDASAFVFNDGRVHVFMIWQPNQERLFETFLSTVEFLP